MTTLPPVALADWHQRFPGLMAGSVYAVEPHARSDAARVLAVAGLDVHVDLMAESERMPAGVSLAELRDIANTVHRKAVGVHLIGSAEFVDATLPEVLPLQPGVVFLPWAAFTDDRARLIRATGGAAWIAIWREWEGLADPAWPAAPDGALVMLIEPGTRNNCVIERMSIVAACASEMPVAVDGGITEEIAPLCVSAGAQSLVVGRSLLLDLPTDPSPAIPCTQT